MKRLALAAAVLIGLGTAGCGNSSGSLDVPLMQRLTKAEFLGKANALCRQANQKQNAAARKEFGIKQPTMAQIVSFAEDSAIPGISDQIKELRALGFHSPIVARMLTNAEHDVTKLRSNAAAFLTSDRDPFANFKRTAHRYGLTACAPSSNQAIK